MESKYPKISIVTPSFNQGDYIEETICSILDQGYPNLEYIIIDGGSTDKTLEIISKYKKFFKYCISEKDDGQANAINKGLKYCTGDIFNWINSDDYLEKGSLNSIAEAFSDSKVQLVAGKVRNFDTFREEVIQNHKLSAKGLMCWEKDVKFIQPGVWMRRDLIEKCGGIDENFNYAFDWDLYIRYLYFFPKVKEIPALLVHFRLHENSKTQALLTKFVEEEREIIHKIFSSNEFSDLRKTCENKIEKTNWTFFLSKQSKTNSSFIKKCWEVVRAMRSYKTVSISRQTAGAIRAFWKKQQI